MMEKITKKVVLTFAIVCSVSLNLGAVPARPTPVVITQADGTKLELTVKGDEFFHYMTTSDGYVVSDKDGIFYYALFSGNAMVLSSVKANDPSRRTAEERKFVSSMAVTAPPAGYSLSSRRMSGASRVGGLTTGFPTKGEIRSLVILANFSDTQFQSPAANSDFSDMLNQSGYSQNGATGSALDFFLESSSGQFTPVFDVVGPVTLSRPCSYYGENKADGDDNDAEGMIAEACRLADEVGVNFADYDYNNDNIVDNVFVFYAGTNEADGGGADKIWPHRFNLELGEAVFDGKSVYVYACTSELKMTSSGPEMAGIGTFCHEFSHVLGIPDFYDTDGYTGGYSEGVGTWSIMDQGPYNNEGRTPPVFNAMERSIAGWIELEEIVNTGDYVLNDLQEYNEAYMLSTDTGGEFFVLENRQNSHGWDAYLPGHGMLIYHVDRSDRMVVGLSAIDRWEYNWPNNVSSHECFRIIPALLNAGLGDEASMPWPGASGYDEFSRKSLPANTSWSGENIPAELFSISEEAGTIYFRAVTPEGEIVPVSGVELSARQKVIVYDTVQVRAHIIPENAHNQKVTWYSESPEILSVDTLGLVKALSKGTGVIRAVTEDGEFADEIEITVTDGMLLRARTVTSSGFPLEGIPVQMESGTDSYTFTSGPGGVFSQEGIVPGEYLMEVSGQDYPVQRKVITIVEGASVCDIILFSAEELEKGTGVLNPSVVEYENSAYLTWKPTGALRYRVEWYPAEEPENVEYIFTEVYKADITGLKRDTEYEAIVYVNDGITDGDFKKLSFRTALPFSEYPLILLNSIYLEGETIILKAANIPEGAVMEWYVDGEPFTGELELKNPEYRIDLVLSTDSDTAVVTKYISVVKQNKE